ncbi:GNAT family N-acetyltransferase [Paenibacillus polymyxa]|uniref:GNAT family N-acetyltransferase n=2 Tax=Paenibacillus polymyxa TaxID=1406 RepID=UPI0002DA4E70|nr:GNAT family N-acetyltransferase [Paenibacillus polymyxa]MCJ1222982.1 GNAT family N-acetyltransferase [Paenibacillus polymyxa]NMP09961.1 GNAT family N-acetyltransferase [Paenibacillus polymyxa]
MFKNIKPDSAREEVLELLTYAVLDHPERGEAALRAYQALDEWKLFGVEDEGLIVGVVGFEEREDGTIVLHHLAVLPENRHRGYGRGMLLTLIKERSPKRLMVDTDAEGADFFRNVGFAVYGSEDLPDGGQFHCVYEIDEE